MPFAPHLRLTMSGQIRDANNAAEIERFAIRLNMTAPSTGDFLSQAAVDDVAADASAFWANGITYISHRCILDEVKLASIGADGKYTADPAIATVNTPGGHAAELRFPPQVSLAVSFDTDRRGSTGRGRFFLPGVNIPLDATYGTSAVNADGVRDSVVAFVNALNNWPNVDAVGAPEVCVASSKGYNSVVTGVRVGRVYDTMRSRRQALVERYSATAAIA